MVPALSLASMKTILCRYVYHMNKCTYTIHIHNHYTHSLGGHMLIVSANENYFQRIIIIKSLKQNVQ